MVIPEGVGKSSEPDRYSILPTYTETYELTGRKARNSKLGLEPPFMIQESPACFFLSSWLTHLHHYVFQQITTFFSCEKTVIVQWKGRKAQKHWSLLWKQRERQITSMEKWPPMVLHKVLKLTLFLFQQLSSQSSIELLCDFSNKNGDIPASTCQQFCCEKDWSSQVTISNKL